MINKQTTINKVISSILNCLTHFKVAAHLCYLRVKPVSGRKQSEKSRIILKRQKENAWDCLGETACGAQKGLKTPNPCHRFSLCFALLSVASTHLGLTNNSVEIWAVPWDCLLDGPEQTHWMAQKLQHLEKQSETLKKRLEHITSSISYN